MNISEFDDDLDNTDPAKLLSDLWKQVGSKDGKIDIVCVVDFLHSCHSRLCYNEERILNIEAMMPRRQH